MKSGITGIAVLLWFVVLLVGCNNEEVLFRLEVENETLELAKGDVVAIRSGLDSAGESLVAFELTEDGVERITAFTRKHVGKNVSLYFRDRVLLKDVPIGEPLTMDEIHVRVESEEEAREIAGSLK